MGGEGSRLGEGVSIGILEAAATGTKDLGGDEGSVASSHVDNTGSSEVDHANATERVRVESGNKARRRPDGAHDDGVNKGGEEEGVCNVGRHLAALGDGTGNDGGSSGSEGPLEEEGDVCVTDHFVGVSTLDVPDKEHTATNKSGTFTVGEGISDGPESDGSSAGVEEILEHDILDILLTDGTGTEHGEASLHEENESSLFNWNVFVWGQDRFADWGEELE